MSRLSRAMELYLQNSMGGKEFEFEVKENENDKRKIEVFFVVDYSKIDKNSNNFDSDYYEKVMPKRPVNPNALYFKNPIEKIENVVKELKPFFGLDYTPFTRLRFKNYDHLDEIVDMIEKGLKELEPKYGKVDFEFSVENNLKLRLEIVGEKTMTMSSYDFKNEFLEDLKNKILELFNKKIDLDSYNIHRVVSF